MFRLTDLELKALRRVCEAKGGRSLSEFARTELLNSAQSIEVAALDRQLASMEHHLSRVEAMYIELIYQVSRAQV